MAIYSQEDKEFHLEAVERLLIFRPDQSAPKLREQLSKLPVPYDLGLGYIQQLKREIQERRIKNVQQQTKELVVAEMESLGQWCVDRLRQVISEEFEVARNDGSSFKQKYFSQTNRIKAVAEIFKIFDRMTQLKMDLGILERKLGTVDVENEAANLLSLVKLYREAHGDINNVKIYDAETMGEGEEPGNGDTGGRQLPRLSQ